MDKSSVPRSISSGLDTSAGPVSESQPVDVSVSGACRVADVFIREDPRQVWASIEGRSMLIQKLRLQRGWSQEQLAELSGLSVRTVQRIERGQPASLETLKALGAAFEIDFSDLKESDMDSTSSHQTLNRNVSNDEALALAHVRKLKAFYFNLMLYGVVIGFLAIVNLVTYRHYLWFFWPALGWGIGLLFYGLSVFDKVPFLNAEWERRQVEKRLGRKL
jgi:transcriptional regulator with XRE-family HTH domain